MDTTLKIRPNNAWVGLDIYEDLPISVVITQDDITDIGGGGYQYSKTFTIPGTKHNNKIFEGFYSFVGVDFNPLTKVECVVESGGAVIFEGFLRLNAVLQTGDYNEYEVYILSAVSDFSSELQALTLKDLDYQDLSHENDYDTIVQSWEYSGGTTGLFNGQILYPLYNYGLIYDDNDNPSFSFSTTGSTAFTGNTNPVPVEYFKPSIQLKSVVDRIFSATTYSYNSDFFNSDYFKSIYMSLANDGEIGVIRDEETENRNVFKVYASGPLNYYYNYDSNDNRYPLVFNTLDPDGYDPLNSYTLDNDFPGTSPDFYRNYFNVPTAGDYAFNLKFGYFNLAAYGGYPNYFRIKVYKSKNPQVDIGTLVYQTPGSGYAALNVRQEANVFFNFTLEADDFISVFMDFIDTAGVPDSVRLIGPNGEGYVVMDLYDSPTLLGSTNVNMTLQMPDLSASEYMESLIKMFNLTIEKDEVNQVLNIEPWNVYFNETGRTQSDWTQKLNMNETIRVEPFDFDLSKDVVFTYQSAGDRVLGKYYEETFKNIFGSRTEVSSSNILTGEQRLEIPFTSFPTNTIDGSSNIIMGQTFKRDDNGLEKPYASDPSIFFWTGNRYFYNDKSFAEPISWYMSSGLTSVEQTTYPCVSHLSRLAEVSSNEISDLNYRPYWDFFQTENDRVQPWSSYTLYTSFWQEYIQSIYSIESRRLSGKFYLEPKDIGEIKLNDKIFVKNNFWRIESIEDADLVNPSLVKVKLVKELGGFYDKQPPAPEYITTPNQAYPPPYTNTLSWYFENQLGSYAPNITIPNFELRQVSPPITLVNTSSYGSGSVSIYPGTIRSILSFTYQNILGSINNLEITFGTSSGDDSYGILQIPQPGDNVSYELDVSNYIPASGNFYATINTY